MVNYCVAGNCRASKYKAGLETNNLSLHRFPSDPVIREKWIQFVRETRSWWQPNKHARLCSDHFSDGCWVKKLKKRMLLSNAIPSMHTPNTGPQLQYFPQPAPAPVKSHCKGNSFIEIGLRNECELQTDDLGYNYFTQIWESTDIAFVHIGDATSDNRAKITITSMEQDFKTERRFFQTFKDNQCVIPLNGALLTSEEEGSIILDLKLDSAISMQDFLQHKLKEILTCLLSIVKDKLRLNVRVDSQFSVDVKDGLSGHRGEPAVTKSKTVTEKEIQTKLTWIKSTPTMIHSPPPSDLPPNMSNKETPPTNLMDTPSPSETASLSSTPSKSDDDTEKVMKKHKTQTQSDSYIEKSPSKSSDWSGLDFVKKEAVSPPSPPRSSPEKTSVSSAKDKPQAVITPKKIKACHKLFIGQLRYFERPQTKISGYFKIARVIDNKESGQYLPLYVGKSDDIGHRLDQLFKSQPDTVPSSSSPSSIDTYLAGLTPEEYENISVFWVDRTQDQHQCKGRSMRDCFIGEWGAQLEFMDKDEDWSEGEETRVTNTARKVIILCRQKSNVQPGFSSSPKKRRVSPTQKTFRLSQLFRPVASRNGDVVDNLEHESAYRIMTPECVSGSDYSPKNSVGGPSSTSESSTTLGYSDLKTKYSLKRTPFDSSPADIPLKLKKPKLERELPS